MFDDLYADYRQVAEGFTSGVDDIVNPNQHKFLRNVVAPVFTPLWSATRRVIGDDPFDYRQFDADDAYRNRGYQYRKGFSKKFQLLRDRGLQPSAVTSRDGFKSYEMPKSKTQKRKKKGPRARQARKSQTEKKVSKVLRKALFRGRAGKRKTLTGISRRNYLAKAKMVSVPTAMAYNVVGSGYEFKSGRRAGCIRMRSKIYIGDMEYQNFSGDLYSGIRTTNLAGSVQTNPQWYFNPMNSYYVGNGPLATMAAMFRRYYVNAMSLEYDPAVSSATPGTLNWCAPMSVDYWDSLYINSSDVPRVSDILNITNSKAGALWVKSTLPIPVDRKEEYWVVGPDFNNNPFAYSDDIASQRQTYASTVGLSITGVPLPSTDDPLVVVGRVFLHLDIELCDMCSAATDPITKLTKLKHGPRLSNKHKKDFQESLVRRLERLEGDSKVKPRSLDSLNDTEFEHINQELSVGAERRSNVSLNLSDRAPSRVKSSSLK